VDAWETLRNALKKSHKKACTEAFSILPGAIASVGLRLSRPQIRTD